MSSIHFQILSRIDSEEPEIYIAQVSGDAAKDPLSLKWLINSLAKRLGHDSYSYYLGDVSVDRMGITSQLSNRIDSFRAQSNLRFNERMYIIIMPGNIKVEDNLPKRM
jgi:hypothetical protein